MLQQPLGTYYVPVQYFLQAYLQQVEANQINMGNEDYELPAESVYSECTYKAVNGVDYYVMAGCDDTDRHQLAVNIYSDNTCETPSKNAAGMDDANIDISDIQIPFQQCQQCVIWMDVNDDEVDDKYYENKQISAPLCSKVWSLKEKCGMKCKRLSKEKGAGRSWWNGSDVILLLAMSAFAGGCWPPSSRSGARLPRRPMLCWPTPLAWRSELPRLMPYRPRRCTWPLEGIWSVHHLCPLRSQEVDVVPHHMSQCGSLWLSPQAGA